MFCRLALVLKLLCAIYCIQVKYQLENNVF